MIVHVQDERGQIIKGEEGRAALKLAPAGVAPRRGWAQQHPRQEEEERVAQLELLRGEGLLVRGRDRPRSRAQRARGHEEQGAVAAATAVGPACRPMAGPSGGVDLAISKEEEAVEFPAHLLNFCWDERPAPEEPEACAHRGERLPWRGHQEMYQAPDECPSARRPEHQLL